MMFRIIANGESFWIKIAKLDVWVPGTPLRVRRGWDNSRGMSACVFTVAAYAAPAQL